MAALEAGRTTHAYLFSGPRGCGKTTSARILARCLNCVEYPTAKPCGTCDSCKELARDGSGSLDVVELDAASHGGVDDARELREQAGFAPVRDRFKIFIIDEAHMVTNQGFNALLKLVEEPPPHVKFIFATTEPEKVIGTIRSRTHHYPFRLVPPLDLEKYLALLCAQEGVSAGKDLLSLVVRAGTGSVRDTLSVLDQIIGGSEGTRLDYDRAVALLGYTSATLLDEAVDAISARDGAALFGVVDKVVKSGHDPRRFVEDTLQRLRDLVIIALAGEEAKDVFVSVPEDQYARMIEQAARLGAERASQCADLTNEALSEMAGATAPRLQLELLCARLVIARVGAPATPAVHSGPEAPTPEVASNLAKFRKPATQSRSPQDPVSRPDQAVAKVRSEVSQHQAPQEQAPQAGRPQEGFVQQESPVERQRRMDQIDPRQRPMPAMPATSDDAQRVPVQPDPAAEDARTKSPYPAAVAEESVPAPSRSVPPARRQERNQASPTQAEPAQAMEQRSAMEAPPRGADPLAQVAAQWATIMQNPALSRIAHAQLDAARGPVAVEGGVLVVGFEQPGVAGAFTARGAQEVEKILATMGINLRVEGRVGGEPPAPKADAAQGAAPVPASATTHASSMPTPAREERARIIEAHHRGPAAATDRMENSVPGANSTSGMPAPLTERLSRTPDSATFHQEAAQSAHPPLEPSTDSPDDPEPDYAAIDRGPDYLANDPAPDYPASEPEPGYPDKPAAPARSLADETFPMPPPAHLPGELSTNHADPADVGHSVVGLESFHVPPVEDPYTHTARGKWSPPLSLPNADRTDPDDVVEPAEDDPEWEGASADDPDISQSTVVGLQVVLDRFDAKVIEEREEA